MEDFLIIGLVMAFMGLLKKYVPSFPKEAYFIPIIFMAVAFNAGGVYLVNGVPTNEAIVAGIRLGAEAAGVFGLGKAALGRS